MYVQFSYKEFSIKIEKNNRISFEYACLTEKYL